MSRHNSVYGKKILALAFLVANFLVARGTDFTVDIKTNLNSNIRTWTSGDVYPPGGFTANMAGVPFYVPGFPGVSDGLGVVFTGVGSPAAPVINNFPLSVTNPVSVYTIMNSSWGRLGATNGTIEFFGAEGAHAVFYLVQGLSLRDHFNGTYNNVVASDVMSLQWGSSKVVRLDAQGWLLPETFHSQILTNIQVKSFGDNPSGVPTVAAITVRTTGPLLTLHRSGTVAKCLWPATPTNYILQSTASLEKPAWITVTAQPFITNNQAVVFELLTAPKQFYRLLAVP